MPTEARAYLDTSALAKWYLNEAGSEAFVTFLQGLDSAVISSLTQTEMRSLLSRRRRMGDLSAELESLLFAARTNQRDEEEGLEAVDLSTKPGEAHTLPVAPSDKQSRGQDEETASAASCHRARQQPCRSG